jgi:ATP-dependent HslUV protease ATP-binding subunit HslU
LQCLSSCPETTQSSAGTLTPRQIVAELDKYVVGQAAAKRAVAIALRNRMRRQKLAPELAEEIAPKNILMIGPTGVGKTEIARRLARLAQSPFLKVEPRSSRRSATSAATSSRWCAISWSSASDMVRAERIEEVRAKAASNAEDRLLDILLPPRRPPRPTRSRGAGHAAPDARSFPRAARAGRLDSRVVEIEVREKVVPVVRDHRRLLGRGGRHQPEGHAAGPVSRARRRSAS